MADLSKSGVAMFVALALDTGNRALRNSADVGTALIKLRTIISARPAWHEL